MTRRFPTSETDPDAILADLTSGDATRIWSASSAVIHLRAPAALDRLAPHAADIRARTTGVDLGGMLIRNDTHIQFALKKLAYWQKNKGCLCRLYPDWLMFNPHREVEDGNVRIDGTEYVGEDQRWVDAYLCTCAVCGQRYRVEEREGHYMWWQWRLLKEKAKA